jgi:hypothetical protein
MAARKPQPEPEPEELQQLADQAAQAAPIGDVNAPIPLKANYPPPNGPAYARVETEVTIRIPPYEGFKFTMWKNHKIRQQDALWTGSWDAKLEVLPLICLSHNGWCDSDGVPLPPFSEPAEFLAECPPDLFAILLDAIREEARRVPDFPTARR